MSDWLLLDTDVLSYLLKGDSRARQFKPLLLEKMLALSFMSEAELYRWSIVRNWGEARTRRLEKALQRYLTLPYDREVGWAWAGIMARCSQAGRTVAPSDAWVAATALRHDIPLLTHNLRHFRAPAELCGLRLAEV